LVIAAALLSAQNNQARTFTGVVTDSECAGGDHSRMKMGPNDRECTIACVLAHGADYVLADGRDVFVLNDQKKGEEFAGQKVRVTGVLNGSTLLIQSIAAVQ
jgi:hypothetical protein